MSKYRAFVCLRSRISSILAFLVRWAKQDFIYIDVGWLGHSIDNGIRNILTLQRSDFLDTAECGFACGGLGDVSRQIGLDDTGFDHGDANMVLVTFLPVMATMDIRSRDFRR
jgi:hypothetical protein